MRVIYVVLHSSNPRMISSGAVLGRRVLIDLRVCLRTGPEKRGPHAESRWLNDMTQSDMVVVRELDPYEYVHTLSGIRTVHTGLIVEEKDSTSNKVRCVIFL